MTTSTTTVISTSRTRVLAFCAAALVSLSMLMGIDQMAEREYDAALAASTQAASQLAARQAEPKA